MSVASSPRRAVPLLAILCGCADPSSSEGDATSGATGLATSDGTPTTAGTTPGSVSDTAPSTDPTDSGDPTSADGSDGSTGEPMTVCDGDCHYVRAGAAGTGSDWDDALGGLPEVLEAGHAYFVAAGTYPPYTFDDPSDDGAPTRVLRATATDHGTDVGWDPTWADGEAEFGPLVFTAAGTHFDGRGATRIVGTFESTVVEIAAAAVEFRGCDVDGAFSAPGGTHQGGACSGMNISGDGVVVANNVIHDAADDGVAISGSSGVSFRGNTIHALHACGTDGGCGPCYNGHSDGIEVYDLHDSELVGNLVYDVRSTAALFFGNWADELGGGPDEYCENLLVANNLLYTPETGFAAYLEDATGVQFVGNVVWGLRQGAYGGLAIGVNVAGLDLYDNAILSINYDHLGSSHDAAEHRGDYNLFGVALGQWPEAEHDLVIGDPRFTGIGDVDAPAVAAPVAEDFIPAKDSPLRDAGWDDGSIGLPAVDYFGVPRDDTPNIGAIE